MAGNVSKVASQELTPPQSASTEVAADVAACPPRSMERPITREADTTRSPAAIVRVGRYEFADCIAQGGMATVHFARLHGDFDFSRIVAVKRLLPHFAKDEQFKAMFVEEARLAARICHPNVVSTLDVVADRGEVILVMDYVHGDSLSALCRHLRTRLHPIAPLAITSAILSDVLRGLACAHTTTDKLGKPLDIVHCDVSPQNILVGADGVARVLDFGIAKATNSMTETTDGVIRGKPGYMAPEQLTGASATPQSDLFAVGVVLWELLTGQRLFGGGFKASLERRHHMPLEPPSSVNPDVGPLLDAVTMRALASDADQRFRDAAEMMRALEQACAPARPAEVAEWVEQLAAHTLAERGALLTRLESKARRKSIPVGASTAAEWVSPEDLQTESFSALDVQSFLKGSWLPKKLRSRVLLGGALGLAVGVGTWVLPLDVERGLEPTDGSGGETILLSSTSPGGQLTPADEAAAAPPVPSAATSPSSVATASPSSVASEGPANPLGRSVAPSATSAAPLASKTPKGALRGTARPNCSPPYTVDSAGRKHYRAECFR